MLSDSWCTLMVHFFCSGLNGKTNHSLTQFSSADGEVSLQYGELLDLLGVGRGSGVDALHALLNGIIDSRLPVGDDLRHFSGRDAELSANIQGLGAQFVCGLAVVVYDALSKAKRVVIVVSFHGCCGSERLRVTLRVISMERNLSLSPSSMALLMMGTSAFSASSMGTGGMFSPPAVMISSVKNTQ